MRPERPKPGSCMNLWVERKWRTIGSESPECRFQAILNTSRLVDGHSHVLAKMFGPRGYQVFQMEQAGLIQTFVEPALERAVPPTCSLNFLHQNSKPLSILVSD